MHSQSQHHRQITALNAFFISYANKKNRVYRKRRNPSRDLSEKMQPSRVHQKDDLPLHPCEGDGPPVPLYSFG